jgi:UDP-N-acetylglucosamine--N-acetylmuramyl-(pentapeptide) pyrophosphoryl-undecaprenol N-acetylglucosamine transferase
MSSESHLKVIVSGGGTGGHIFPAVAIANAIKKKYTNAEILFVGAKGKMEMEKVPKAGYPIKGLWISGLQRKLTFANLLFPLKVLVSLINSMFIIKSFKPDIAIGVGG